MEKRLTTPSLLVAMPHLLDPNFRRTVVLLVENDPSHGSMGFIVNRQATQGLGDLVEVEGMHVPPGLPTWYGGPVDTRTGLLLHAEDIPGATRLTGGAFLSTTQEALNRFATSRHDVKTALYPFRFLAGYAGWGAGQLYEEMRLGAWMQIPFDHSLLFNVPWQDMWEVAMTSQGIDPSGLAPTVHPYLN